MKTVKYTFVDDEDKEITLTAVCVSRQGLRNIEKLCSDIGDEGSLEASIITSTCTDYIPQGWHILSVTRAEGYEWRTQYEAKAIEDIIGTCEPSLAGESVRDCAEREECRNVEILLAVDEEMEDAPELAGLIDAYQELQAAHKASGFDSVVELAGAAHKAFAKTAIAQAFGLEIKYDADEDRIYVDGRPELARNGKVDTYFCGGILRELELESLAEKVVDDKHYVCYDFHKDVLEIDESGIEEEEA